MIAQRIEHAFFQPIPADVRPIIAGTLVARRRAANEFSRDHRVAATATSAFGQPRKDVFGGAGTRGNGSPLLRGGRHRASS